jgi:hypothetical protein
MIENDDLPLSEVHVIDFSQNSEAPSYRLINP